jgi:alkylation response protein AidB-like acyl-CoA dehydrogenase
MDFHLSPPQRMLTTTARAFLRQHCPPELVQRLALDARGFDEALWRRMAELGWPGLLISSDLGGSDGSLLDVIVLVEEMGRAGLPGPFVASAVVATSLVLAAPSPAQHKRMLPSLAAGERIATLALVEESGSFDLDAVALACTLPGRLGGRKLFEVTFDRVAVGADDLLGGVGDGAALLSRALRAGSLARTAEMVGAAQRVLELAVEHAKTRVQGGRPIGGHQAIQHACADLVRDVDAARALLYAAAWKETEGRAAEADVALAKAYAGEACLAVARRGHQIFGAISYCEEHPLHLLHKRIQAASLDFGDAQLHLETVARAIGLEDRPQDERR